MRTVAAVILGVTLAVGLLCVAHAADPAVKVYVDGKLQNFDPTAIVRDGKSYVPLRQSATALGATVNYDAANRIVQMVYCDKVIRLKQSEGLTLDGSIFVPLRKVSEAFGCKVSYDAANVAVRIDKPKTSG